MFCRNCGSEIEDGSNVCMRCSVPVGVGFNYCPNCGKETEDGLFNCPSCGALLRAGAESQKADKNNIKTDGAKPLGVTNSEPSTRTKLFAGILGIFFGHLGIHNFYLGFTKKAIIQIVVTLCTCGIGGLWGFVQGVMILCGHIDKDVDGRKLQ